MYLMEKFISEHKFSKDFVNCTIVNLGQEKIALRNLSGNSIKTQFGIGLGCTKKL